MSSSFAAPGAFHRDGRFEAHKRVTNTLSGYRALILIVVLLTVEVALLLAHADIALQIATCLVLSGVIVWRARHVAAKASGRRAAGSEGAYWSSNRQAFLETGNRMIAQCRRTNQALSVIVFEQSDLPELQCIFGEAVAQQMAAKLAGTLQTMVKSKGLAVRTDPTVFTVLLPGFGLDRTLALIKEAFGDTLAIEFDVEGDDVVLVPDFLVQTVRSETTSIKDVYTDLRKAIKRSQDNEERRQRYLKRERESHSSKAMPLMESDSTYPHAPRHELTVPVPLATR